MPKGGGYWLWKFDIILNRLKQMKDGDFLVYLDAGCTINPQARKRFDEYIQMVEDSKTCNFLSFQIGTPERYWTTKQLFSYFSLDLDSDFAMSGQFVAGVLIMQKCSKVIEIFEQCTDLLGYDASLATDAYNSKGTQHKDFIDHRHDQSILSLVRKMEGNSIVIPDETWFPNFECEKAQAVPFWATRFL